jgi:predicted aminopeptidase
MNVLATALRRLLAAAGLALTLGLSGCAGLSLDLGYYLQSMGGHLAVMRAARPIAELLDDPGLDAALRARLERVREIRAFASRELGLPENGSYTRYADLGRPAVLWNVFAAPELSLTLDQWCFPVAGCISYRGYYDRGEAERFAESLREHGRDTYVTGVPAYSTLGWFDDPVLNTFIQYPEGELARLLFHELAHQVLYVPGDSTFNESFATAVEEAGVERWLARRGDPAITTAYREHAARRTQFVELLKRKRDELDAVYRSDQSDELKRRGKEAVLASLQLAYAALKSSWGGYTGYDRWFAQKVSNAHLGSVATYTDHVPGFRRLLGDSGGDLPRFYAAARDLAARARHDRDQALSRP